MSPSPSPSSVPPLPGGAQPDQPVDMQAMAGAPSQRIGSPDPQQRQMAMMMRIKEIENTVDALTSEMGSGAGQAAQDVKTAIRKWMAAGLGKPQQPEAPVPQGLA